MIDCVIKNRWTGEVICSGQAEDFKSFVVANLGVADLRGANLRGANLRGADLDFSCWTFACKTLRAIIDDKLRTQLLYHTAKPRGEIVDPDLKELLESDLFKKVANKFHRVEECGEIK